MRLGRLARFHWIGVGGWMFCPSSFDQVRPFPAGSRMGPRFPQPIAGHPNLVQGTDNVAIWRLSAFARHFAGVVQW